MIWGIIPAAGTGTRIQPLAFSKELLPVGSALDAAGVERPRAVSEYIVERMILGGATRVCFVIAPGKADIVAYYGGSYDKAQIAYVVQTEPLGLCDALFRALAVVNLDDHALVGLPDTIWYPSDALARLPDGELSFLCFPVADARPFDAVVADPGGAVTEIQVKSTEPTSQWVWGAFKLTGRILHELAELWREPGRGDVYVGTLVNAWLARGGRARCVRAGASYVDVGTVVGWRAAIQGLDRRIVSVAPQPYRATTALPRRAL